jgi:outer membrane murein-binding lipoprotein Lpp
VTLVRRLLVVALAVTIVAGCGGGGGKRLSRTEFAAKADAICRKYSRLSQAVANPTSLAELSAAVKKLTPLLDQSLGELRKLNPPKNEQATVDRWLGEVEAIRNDLAKVGDKAAKKDTKGVGTALRAGGADQQRGNQLAGRLGMTDCSE